MRKIFVLGEEATEIAKKNNAIPSGMYHESRTSANEEVFTLSSQGGAWIDRIGLFDLPVVFDTDIISIWPSFDDVPPNNFERLRRQQENAKKMKDERMNEFPVSKVV